MREPNICVLYVHVRKFVCVCVCVCVCVYVCGFQYLAQHKNADSKNSQNKYRAEALNIGVMIIYLFLIHYVRSNGLFACVWSYILIVDEIKLI